MRPLMRFTIAILLSLLAACASEDAVTPTENRDDGDPTQNATIMVCDMSSVAFRGAEFCDDMDGPPALPVWISTHDPVNDLRLKIDLTQAEFEYGVPNAMGFDTDLTTPDGHYFVHDNGFGTVTVTQWDDDEIRGTIDATLLHQRDDTDTALVAGTFSADPYTSEVTFSGHVNGAPFEGVTGRESLPRVRARVCVEDTTWSDGKGAVVALTTDNISGDFVGSYTVEELIGFASITVEAGGEFFNAVSGTLKVDAVKSVAAESAAIQTAAGAVAGQRTIITDATFNFVGVNVIVFGDVDKDTIWVDNGRLLLTGLPDSE